MLVVYDRVLKCTEKAILFLFDQDQVWIPISQIDGDSSSLSEEGGTVDVAQWLVDEKNLEVYAADENLRKAPPPPPPQPANEGEALVVKFAITSKRVLFGGHFDFMLVANIIEDALPEIADRRSLESFKIHGKDGKPFCVVSFGKAGKK